MEEVVSYVDGAFSIYPSEGDIWPKCSQDFSIIFQPVAAKSYETVAFCDVTGRGSRLPLSLCGNGIGPLLKFSYDYLEMGNIFVGSKHSYDVILANKGFIDASFQFQPSKTKFASRFEFQPRQGYIEAGNFQAISVSFRCRFLGNFEEQFTLEIGGSDDKLKLTFRYSNMLVEETDLCP